LQERICGNEPVMADVRLERLRAAAETIVVNFMIIK
jgi:hypothetical protein